MPDGPYNLDAHRPMPSRAAAALDVDGRAAADRAQRARAEARSRVLDRAAFTLGRVGTSGGRELEVIWTEGGIVVLDQGRALSDKFVAAFTFDQVTGFIDLLVRALESLNNPIARGDVGVVRAIERTLLIERATGQVVVREVNRASDRLPVDGGISRSASTLFSVNGTQASKLIETLRRGQPLTTPN